MAHARVGASHAVRYGKFLYAIIGEDADSGLFVSMLSALARQDLDPWEIAESLAQMPEAAAVERCAMLVRKSPCVAGGREHAVALARRMIAWLPDGSTALPPAAPAARDDDMLNRVRPRHAAATLARVPRRPTVHYLFFYFMFVVFFFCSQWLSPSPEQAPVAPASSVEAPRPEGPVDSVHGTVAERGR